MWTKAQANAFGVQLMAAGEVFNEPVSGARIELFIRLVEDLPFDAVEIALADHARASAFYPKPAEVRLRVLGHAEDRAELAWQFVVREVRRVGWAGTPSWPDEATKRAALGLYGGGWRTLCEHLPASGPEALGVRKQFVAVYAAASRQALVGELPPSREQATAALSDLKAQLTKRGLATGKL